MKKHLSIAVATLTLCGTLACSSTLAQTQVVIHSMWCLQANSNSVVTQKPLDRGTCGAIIAGSLLASYFADDPEIARQALTKTEKELGKMAAQQACYRNSASNQIAIRLLQVCQCHNPTAIDVIENNQTEAVTQLLEWRRVTGDPC